MVERVEEVIQTLGGDYEFILVNDGSLDSSWDVIKTIQVKNNKVRAINLRRNYGQHNALLCGIRAARFEVLITLDDDLQHPPEEIPKLLERLQEGYDVVYGAPLKQQHGILRDIASVITKIALKSAMGIHVANNVSAFRVFKRDIRTAFENYSDSFVSIDVLLTWGSTRFSAVNVRHDTRDIGTSNYSFSKLVTHALNMMTGFSTLPLQLSTFLGFAMTGLGFVTLIWILTRFYVEGNPVPGFPFLACLITIFSGAQLFSLGIIGEYLARIHFRTMRRPPYAISEEQNAITIDKEESFLNE